MGAISFCRGVILTMYQLALRSSLALFETFDVLIRSHNVVLLRNALGSRLEGFCNCLKMYFALSSFFFLLCERLRERICF